MISSLEKSSDKMKQTYEQSQEQMCKVLRMQTDERQMRQKLGQIVEDCIDVDMQKLDNSMINCPRDSPQKPQPT